MSAYANDRHPDTLDVEAQIRDAYRQLATGPERAAGRLGQLHRLGSIVPSPMCARRYPTCPARRSTPHWPAWPITAMCT
jgi:hypothetical protein